MRERLFSRRNECINHAQYRAPLAPSAVTHFSAVNPAADEARNNAIRVRPLSMMLGVKTESYRFKSEPALLTPSILSESRTAPTRTHLASNGGSPITRESRMSGIRNTLDAQLESISY